MNKVNFLMAIHFHQPVGNFDFVFDKVCKNSYQPFIETVEEFPDIKLTFHFTGCLLEWLEAHKPKLLENVLRLVKRGQVEIMTGGFYEPILPVIPYNDRLGQIAMLSNFVKKNFAYNPQGAWIAERVWEPNLASVLNEAGVKYIILDDTHLKCTVSSPDDLHGYYVTEDSGKALAVFPSDKKLRYLIPFSQQNQVIDYLRSVSNIADGLAAVYGDDAEKFGEWPDTYEWVYEKRWLYNFFLSLRQNNSWVKTIHMSEYLKENEPLGRAYIPTASYEEMAEWSGCFWRNFLTKYPESNQMHKKMIRVSEKLQRVIARSPAENGTTKQPPSKEIALARQELYKGQCNCSYWHGVFGGLYLYHLRAAVWNHLIKSEIIVDDIIKGAKHDWVDCEIADFDSDGCDEVILSNSKLSLFFDCDEGGAITELDFKPKAVNVVNTLARRKEAYHAKLLEQSLKNKAGHAKSIHEREFENIGLANRVFYDWYRRSCLLDHFLGSNTTIEKFSKCQYDELGDFVNQAYKIKESKGAVALSRAGQVDGEPLSVVKTIELKKAVAEIKVAYTIKNISSEEMDLWFGSELNFSLSNDKVFEQLFGEKELTLSDAIAGIKIRLNFSKPADIWRFPVNTISQSESDIEENYQSSVAMPNWKFKLTPGQNWQMDLNMSF